MNARANTCLGWAALLLVACGESREPGAEGEGDTSGWPGIDAPAPPGPGPVCGDHVLDPGEECDLGLLNADDAPCKSDCTWQRCGDGFVGPGEDCDDLNDDDNDSCVACQTASCGDGVVQFGIEACDDANTDDTDACLSTCVVASCGDGFTWAGVEVCDDGNADDTDACPSTCEPASCGDGFVQAGVEECDDGELGAVNGCSAMCELNYVFVTASPTAGGLGGINGADVFCQGQANQAALPGMYQAWISGGGQSASSRLVHANTSYILVDGTKIADNWDDLVDGNLDAGIMLSQSGSFIFGGSAWTGTTWDGNGTGSDCASWSTNINTSTGTVGQISSASASWSNAAGGACNSGYRLYCFRALSAP